MKFTISILALNNLSLTRRCLESVLATTNPDETEVILTDNGSTDGTREFFQPHPGIAYVRNEKNEGFIEPNRKAFERAKGEFFILLNNDTVVPPGWLEKLEAPFRQFPTAALSGPDQGCSELGPDFHGRVGQKEYLEGACLCCRVSVIRKVGLFSPELSGAYGEDSDLSLRCREQGYTLHWCKDLKIQHARGATSAMVPQARGWQEANHNYLRRRWGHYLRVRRLDFPILIRRADAWGDVLLVSAIARELKRQRPLSPIHIETNCGDVFANNPNISHVDRKLNATPETLVIDLNMSYEAMREISIIDAYIHFTRSFLGGGFECASKQPDYFFDSRDAANPWPVTELISRNVVLESSKPWIAIHPGPVCWRSKEWGIPKFDALARLLISAGYNVVLVGAQQAAPMAHTIDLRGRTTIPQLAMLLSYCDKFVGLDSFPLHLAQAVKKSTLHDCIYGIFGVTSSKYILTAPNAVGIDAEVESAGSRHRTTNAREVDDNGVAMDSISVERVLGAILA